jgi:hypothetical protein
MSTPQSGPVLSDDGMWWWDGQTWQPAVSADGRLRWDGRQWQPIPGQPMDGQLGAQRSSNATLGRTSPLVPTRLIKVGAAALAIVIIVVSGSLLLTRKSSPQIASGTGYTIQIPSGWHVGHPNPNCTSAFAPYQKPEIALCVPYQEGSELVYSIEVYVGFSLDAVNFKPKPPLATPGFGARKPLAFPGSARSEEISCENPLAGSRDGFPLWCWRVPGGQQADDLNSVSSLCGAEAPNPDPSVNGRFIQLERLVSASHASHDYLIVLSGYHAPRAGFPQQYCRDFYQVLQSWKWQD